MKRKGLIEMKISPDLVVGNIWLHLLEEDVNKTTFTQEDFIGRSQALERIISRIPECVERGRFVEVSLGDILDTAACFTCCVGFVRHPGDDYPSELQLLDKEGSRDNLKRKLKVYIESITPEWLLDAIDKATKENTICNGKII